MNLESTEGLRTAVDRLSAARFPLDTDASEELSELHAEVAEYDAHVAGVAASVLGGARIDRNLLVPDTALRERLETAIRGHDGAGRSAAQQYLAYCILLDDVLTAARRLVEN